MNHASVLSVAEADLTITEGTEGQWPLVPLPMALVL